MPSIPTHTVDEVDPNAIRILITGFGPFWKYKENPSWLAVKPLHNKVIYADPTLEAEAQAKPDMDHHMMMVQDERPISAVLGAHIPPPPQDDPMQVDGMEDIDAAPQQIHITTLEIPVTYQAVLNIAPGLHARPPVLPQPEDPAFAIPPPPPNGYDFMFHIGVAGRGPLRIEKLSHKNSYRMKDAEGQYAPIVVLPKDGAREAGEPNQELEMERILGLGISPAVASHGQNGAEGGNDGVDHPPNRGFGKGYENMPEELHTDVDVAKLIHYLKETGLDNVYSSMDAGHYLCDFLFYCSLAEAKRLASRQEKFKERSSPAKGMPVLFMHVPPVGEPLITEEATEAIKKIVLWVCSRLNS
ncbi:peptidase C15 pyroglutamyl peptidase I-like protein [Obba rivulosa]|uniref:Peptidase C15 pyroglutamyl peptidase I-like protein n=1 Tax=Obba rivulosa TaxID=1052685 RepID=A0A8E2DI33_9APHY|nr:peptidase C15 pyroglutamyl peptidase I-like protein [Obba rivulosa]